MKTWAFNVQPDGTLRDPKLFAQEGGESVAVDDQGNVYIAAGQIFVFDPSGKRIDTIEVPQRPTSLVFDPSGKQIDTIEVPQRPTCLVFAGQDSKTLFITARSSLYSVQTR